MANLRGNSLAGGKPIVTIDMLNKFVEDIQASQTTEVMHKYEEETITSSQVIDAYIKDKSKNGVWYCSNIQNFSIYPWGTLLNFSTNHTRFQLYAPHKRTGGIEDSGLFFRTGWDDDIKPWREVASTTYVDNKYNDINNNLKTEQYLSYNGTNIECDNTFNGRTEGIKIGGKTLKNLIPKITQKDIYKLGYAGYGGSNIKKEIIGECHYKWSKSNNEETRSYYPRLEILKNLEQNKKYTIQYRISSNLTTFNAGFNISYRDAYLGKSGNTTLINISNDNKTSGTFKYVFTTSNSITDVSKDLLYLGFTEMIDEKYWIEISNIVLLEGDWTNKELPEYFEGIQSFGEQEGNKISLFSNNENYFKLTNNTIFGMGTNLTVDNNSFTTTRTTGWNQGFKIRLNKIPMGKYVLKYKIKPGYEGGYFTKIEYFKNNSSIRYSWFENPKDFTINITDYDYFELTFKNFSELTVIGYEYLMILRNDFNINNYIEKKQDKKDIFLKEPLRSIEDVADELYEDNRQVKVDRKLGHYTFIGDDNERWALGKTSGGWTEFDDSLIFYSLAFENEINVNSSIICNRFKYNSNVSKNEISIFNQVWKGLSHPCIRISKSALSSQDVAGFKAWLKANPTTVVYQLATPTTEFIENCVDLNLSTYKDKTYIVSNNNIKGNLDFKVPSNIYSMINNHSKNINKLFNKVENSYFVKTILINDWITGTDSFVYSINHNLNTKLIAHVAATNIDGISKDITYKIVNENTIEIYTMDKEQLDIIIKTI